MKITSFRAAEAATPRFTGLFDAVLIAAEGEQPTDFIFKFL